MKKTLLIILMCGVILFWMSGAFAHHEDPLAFDPHGGAQYYTVPQTIDEAVNSQIFTDSLQMQQNGLRQSPAMSMEEARRYQDIEFCEFWRFMLFPWTVGLSLLYDCYE